MKRLFLSLPAVCLLPLLCGATAHAQTPSAYVVDRTDDSTALDLSNSACSAAANDCSLRGALGRALTDGVNSAISFDPTVFANAQTITLAGAQLIVIPNGTLTITGPANGVTISGNQKSRVFLLGGSPTVALSNLTIANGAANGSNSGVPGDTNTDGAGIANTGTLNLNNVNFSGNVARQNGGGLVNQGGAVTVTGGAFIGNGASFGGGGFASQGGNVMMIGTKFQSNLAVFGGGYVADQGTTSVTNGVFISNTAILSGGGFVNSRGAATLEGCSFEKNGAVGGIPNATIFGGGAAVSTGVTPDPTIPAVANSLTINNCEFKSNFSKGNAGNVLGTDLAKLTVTNTTFNNNTADGDGGAVSVSNKSVLTLKDSVLTANSATRAGGLLVTKNSNATITNTAFNNNAATADGAGAANSVSTSSYDNCSFSGNKATETGGGFFNIIGDLTITNSTFEGNTADAGAGLYNTSSSSAPATAGDPTTIARVSNCTFNANIASGNGGAIYNRLRDESSKESLVLAQCTFVGNKAATRGGAIRARAGLTSVQNCTITSNTAGSAGGGGIASSADPQESAIVRIANTIVSNNSSDVDVTEAAGATFASGGYNLIGTGNAALPLFTASGDQTGVTDPKLGDLTDNGGPTETAELLAGSPAYNAGDPAITGAGQFDQRGDGFPRVQQGRIDIGAFEAPINPQLFIGVSLSPAGPFTNDTVTATPRISDATGVTFNYEFFVNGKSVQSGASNTLNLSRPGFGDKNEEVSVVLTATKAGASGTATNKVTVRNSVPFAFSGTATAKSGETIAVPFRPFGNPGGGDADLDVLTYKRVGGPTNGTGGFVTNPDGSIVLNYTSRVGFVGVEVIRFVAVDDEGRTSNIATLGIRVQGTPQTDPQTQDASGSALSGQTVDVPVTGSDPGGGPVTFKRVGGPTNGVGEFVNLSNGNTVLRYRSRSNFVGIEEVRFVALNAQGRPSKVATIRINVQASGANAARAGNAPSGGSS